MSFEEFIEKLKEIKEAIKQDAHECPSYEDMNRDRDEYFLLMAIKLSQLVVFYRKITWEKRPK